jgi:hypothetical protein
MTIAWRFYYPDDSAGISAKAWRRVDSPDDASLVDLSSSATEGGGERKNEKIFSALFTACGREGRSSEAMTG